MVHDALESIAGKSHSQRMCGFTDLRVSTWGSGHHRFSLDLISLILWLSAPNFADRLTRWLQTCFMQKTCLESTLKMVLQKRTDEQTLPWPCLKRHKRSARILTGFTLTTNSLKLFVELFCGGGQSLWAILWLGAGGGGQPLRAAILIFFEETVFQNWSFNHL